MVLLTLPFYPVVINCLLSLTMCRYKSKNCDKLFATSISCKPGYSQGDKVQCNFTLTNIAAYDLRVLKWQTPLEGIRSRCLNVRRNWRSLPYIGMLVKRKWPPPPQAYLLVRAGESVESTFDLTRGYDLKREGRYRVSLALYNIQYLPSLVSAKQDPRPRSCRYRRLSSRPARFSVISPQTPAPTTEPRKCCPFFKASLSVKPFSRRGNVPITFTLQNNAAVNYTVLKWLTPLEGFTTSFYEVFRARQKLIYRGMFVGRALPASREEYVRVPAGKSVSHTLNLAEAYRLTRRGNYAVRAVAYLQDYYPGDEMPQKKTENSCLCSVDTPFVKFKLR